MSVTSDNLGLNRATPSAWNYPDWKADREKRKRDPQFVKSRKNKFTTISDISMKGEQMRQVLRFSHPSLEVLKVQWDLMHSQKTNGHSTWELTNIDSLPGGDWFFDVKGPETYDKDLSIDQMNKFFVQDVKVDELTEKVEREPVPSNALVEAAMKGGNPGQVVESYLRRRVYEDDEGSMGINDDWYYVVDENSLTSYSGFTTAEEAKTACDARVERGQTCMVMKGSELRKKLMDKVDRPAGE